MNNQVINLIIGLLVGAVSWGVVSIVSDKFEPFDSGVGFMVGQVILSVIAFWMGYKKRIRELLVYLAGAYMGMNIYAYAFGSSEQKAWVLLGMFSTIFLIIYPLVCGMIGKIIYIAQQKYNKYFKADAQKTARPLN